MEEPNPHFLNQPEQHISSVTAAKAGNPSMCYTPGEKVRVVFCVTTYMRTEQLIGLL